MSQPKGRGRASIVAVFTILAIGTLFAMPAYASIEGSVADNECTVTITFDDEGAAGDQAGVRAEAIPPTDEGVIFEDTFFLDDDGDAEITFDLQFTGPPANNGWHVKVDAITEQGGEVQVLNPFFAEDCPDPVVEPPPTTPPVVVPTGGVDTGAASGPGTAMVLPVIGLVLVVGSALWMRRRSIG